MAVGQNKSHPYKVSFIWWPLSLTAPSLAHSLQSQLFLSGIRVGHCGKCHPIWFVTVKGEEGECSVDVVSLAYSPSFFRFPPQPKVLSGILCPR